MEIDELVQEIMEAFISEPDTDYGDETTNQHIRNRGIEAHIRDLVEDYEKGLSVEAESDEISKLEKEIEELRDDYHSLEDENYRLRGRINDLISVAA